MICEIQWNSLALDEWQARFNHINRSTLLQSYPYARAACKTHRQKARWGLIIINGKEAGLVQILEASFLWGGFHALMVDRGPIWFEGFGGAVHIKLFYDELNHQFPKRFGRKRRIIPEIEGGAAIDSLMSQAGFDKQPHQKPYETLWWDLTEGEETAREQLKGKWRGALNKAGRAGLNIEWDDQGKYYGWLRRLYAADKKAKGYGGPSPQLLDNLAVFSTNDDPMIIGRAMLDKMPIACVMFIKHGQSATYQIGWSSALGRQNNAHHLLLWRARHMLQQYGVTTLDLGGVNDEAMGIKKFKEGTNAKTTILTGFYS